jgi:short subunit fatty acids transporter
MARDSRTEFLEREMRPLSAAPEVEVEPQKSSKKVCRIVPFHTTMERALAVVALILLLICVVVIALLAMEKGNDESSKNVTAGKI